MDSTTISEQTAIGGPRAAARSLAAAEALVASHSHRMVTTALGVWEDESPLSIASVGAGVGGREHTLALQSHAARP